jgi:hypothetical protein
MGRSFRKQPTERLSMTFGIGEISGSHGDDFEDDCLLGRCATSQRTVIFTLGIVHLLTKLSGKSDLLYQSNINVLHVDLKSICITFSKRPV